MGRHLSNLLLNSTNKYGTGANEGMTKLTCHESVDLQLSKGERGCERVFVCVCDLQTSKSYVRRRVNISVLSPLYLS